MTIRTINPATEKVIHEYQNITESDLKNKVGKARDAFAKWKTNSKNRAMFLHLLSVELRKNKESLAKVATKEMGKPLKESLSEVEKCAWAMEFYGDNGETFLNPEVINTDARKSYVAFEPVGVIASIMPWNFPYWQALRFAAPSLMAGNTIVLKPA
ncbi:MAG: aldehyde dehydrogenase family protein, partial [Nitrosotalea sp.]